MKKFNDLIGNDSVANLCNAFEEILEQAAKIRKRLNKNSYLLDRYLSGMLETIGMMWDGGAATRGLDITSELRGICRNILTGGADYSDHPFYAYAKSYIDQNPLPFQEVGTKEEIYIAILIHDFLTYEVSCFVKDEKNNLESSVDFNDLEILYLRICKLLGSEDDMMEMERLLYERFLFITPKAEFMQGITINLLYSLIDRDHETSKQIFQIILDRKVTL